MGAFEHDYADAIHFCLPVGRAGGKLPVVDVLAVKSRQALRRTGLQRLAVGGGVAANRCLRNALERIAAEEHAELFIPQLKLCTDNAAMAAMAVERWQKQEWAPLDLDAVPTYVAKDRLAHG